MSVESYLLRLRGQQPDLSVVVAYAQRSLGIMPDPRPSPLTSAYTYYVFQDGLHVIEFEFLQDQASYEISIRFALCHPSSVDRVFLTHVLALMEQFNLTATICEELPEREPREYNKEDTDRFSANCSWSIARSRGYWQQMFGTQEAGLSVADALRKFFLGESLAS